MLKSKLLLFLLVLACSSAFAQDSNVIELIPHFKKDETRKYQIRSTIKSPSVQIFNSTTEDVILKVTNVYNDRIDFEWRYLNVRFTDSIPQYNPIMDLMNTLTKDLTIKYTTDSRGVIKSVTNYNEISSTIKGRVDALIENMVKDKSIDPSLIETTKFQLEMILSTEQQINKIVISDLFKFHELYGRTLRTGSPIQTIDSTLENYTIKLLSFNNNVCRVDGALTGYSSDQKKGYKTYQFQVPALWLTKYTFKMEAYNPILVSQLYEIEFNH